MGTQYCQFCDKEMRFALSVVEIHGYITCGAGKCKQKAKKNYDALVCQQVQEQQIDDAIENGNIELVVVFWSKTPAIVESWKAVPAGEHPEFLLDMDVIGTMLNEKTQAEDPENAGTWYMVMPAADVRDALEQAQDQ